jgi:hypothetical protein
VTAPRPPAPASLKRVARLLALIAALLAWGAALVRYLSDGEVSIALIAAGAFILAVGVIPVTGRRS